MNWRNNSLEEKEVNIKVEYEIAPIRHCVIQCPSCNNWFSRSDFFDEYPRYEYQLVDGSCTCPKCGDKFKVSSNSNIEEDSSAFPEIYNKCLKKKETWE